MPTDVRNGAQTVDSKLFPLDTLHENEE